MLHLSDLAAEHGWLPGVGRRAHGYTCTNLMTSGPTLNGGRPGLLESTILYEIVPSQGPEQGRGTLLYAATSPDTTPGGYYGPRWAMVGPTKAVPARSARGTGPSRRACGQRPNASLASRRRAGPADEESRSARRRLELPPTLSPRRLSRPTAPPAPGSARCLRTPRRKVSEISAASNRRAPPSRRPSAHDHVAPIGVRRERHRCAPAGPWRSSRGHCRCRSAAWRPDGPDPGTRTPR